jgi:hypothetical protein
MFWVNPHSQRNQRQRWIWPPEEAKAQETAERQAFQREALELRRELDELKLELAARRAARLREAEALRCKCVGSISPHVQALCGAAEGRLQSGPAARAGRQPGWRTVDERRGTIRRARNVAKLFRQPERRRGAERPWAYDTQSCRQD